MADPFVGEIRLFGFRFAPVEWAYCDGQVLSIAQNSVLFSVINNVFGGTPGKNFALPKLSGYLPVGMGQGNGLTPRKLGDRFGSQTVALQVAQLPTHNHTMTGATDAAHTAAPEGAFRSRVLIANTGKVQDSAFIKTGSATEPNTSLNSSALAATGGGEEHPNMQPYLPLNFCIALLGTYPVRP